MLLPGQTLAGYQLLALLGKGGQGEVFRARAPWGADVALKVMSMGPSPDGAAVGRFRREMRLLCSIDHPRVLKAHATGEDGGRLWIACALADRGNLAMHLRRHGRLPPAEALAVLADLVAGLIALADAGIAHRDVKPSNLLGFADGWKLGDLGMARRYDPDGSSWTGSGMVVGTAAYLAPELVCGEPADFASDAYAAGCLFFELLTGTPPFCAVDPVAVMQQHLDTPVPDPRRHLPGLQLGAVELVRDLMAKNRLRRLSQPAEVSARIAEALVEAGAAPRPDLQAVRTPALPIEIAPTTTLMPQRPAVPARDSGLAHVRIGLVGRLRLHVWAGTALTAGRDRDPGSGRHARLVLLPEAGHAADNRRISGRHLAFAIGPAGPTVEDLGSSWGTTLRGTRLRRGEPAVLADDDRIVLAGVLTLAVRVLPGGLLVRRCDNAADLAYLLLAGAASLDAEARAAGDVLRLAAVDGRIAWDGRRLADGDEVERDGCRFRIFDLAADDEF